MAPDKEESSKYGADRHCKGNTAVWVQAWGYVSWGTGKVPGTPCCFLGYPNQSPLKKAAEAPSMCEKCACAMRAILFSKENKMSWMLMLSIRGDPSMSLGMCDSLSELTPLQSHSHCCKQLVLHPNQSVILYPTLHRDNSALELLSPCAATLLFIHIFTAMCIFHLGQSQGATEGREYLLGNWDLFANFDFPFCPGEGKKGHIPVSL